MTNRRNFLRQISAVTGGATLASLPVSAMIDRALQDTNPASQGKFITVTIPGESSFAAPLDPIRLSVTEGHRIMLFDGNGVNYFTTEVAGEMTFNAAGALGHHLVLLFDKKGRIIDAAAFRTDARTAIEDEQGEFRDMLHMLVYSCRDYNPAYFRMDGKVCKTYAGWFQDHVHVFKAMKYFDREITSGFDLWAKGQREDGMLADNCYIPWNGYKSWLTRFGERFVWTSGNRENSSTFYIRIPVENMSEFTFLEGIYYAWKATGDDRWMEGKLDHCIRAVRYATSDEYRWSEKFQLLKRGYTIDIWDFTPEMDNRNFGGDIMMARPGITEYSVMFGDNVGMAVGCQYLSEMLAHAGREDEAEHFHELGSSLLERLNKLAWNGSFYQHHVQENPDFNRDFGGTPVNEQVTISNAYAINRRIGHEKAKAIIGTYMRIREEMPDSSPGEWYLCYPPYEKGWHIAKWEYMNGGVSSIVGGEVAHGAFEHGFEEYGAGCLRRLNSMAQLSGNFMRCIYRGAMPDEPARKFDILPLEKAANSDTHGTGAPGVPGFTGEGDNDLSRFPTGEQSFHGIPFHLIDPEENGRRACLIISREPRYAKTASIPYNKRASSLYIIHAKSGGTHMGEIILRYADGTDHRVYITDGVNISGWWYPGETNEGNLRVAAIVTNAKSLAVGAFVYAFDNPSPEKTIASVDFRGAEADGKWIILALTACDHPVWFMPSRVSFGAPDNWGAAAVIYALIEGLAGMKDTGIAFDRATISPRWESAGVNKVKATAKYEASGGYLSYIYEKEGNRLRVSFTGNAREIILRLLLPEGRNVHRALLNSKDLPAVSMERMEGSSYLVVQTDRVGAHVLSVELA